MLIKGNRILCAENNRDECELLQTYLGLRGYEVIPINTIAEGVQKARSQRFDLYIISDDFPDGSGIELTHQIRSFDQSTPLVFHSADAYDSDIENGLKAGAQAYVTKPSDPYEMIAVVENLLDTTCNQ